MMTDIRWNQLSWKKRIQYFIVFKLMRFDPFGLNDHGYYVTTWSQYMLELME